MKSYALIALGCLGIIWIPILGAKMATKPLNIQERYPGMVRLEPGHSIITDKESAKINPLSRSVLLSESLNRILANNAFNNDLLARKIKVSSPDKISNLLPSESSQEFDRLLKSAQNKGIKWNPEAGPWGAFLLNKDRAPQKYPIYGFVELPGGKEASHFLVERNINIILNWVRSKRAKQKTGNQTPPQAPKTEDIVSLFKEALNYTDSPIAQKDAVELYGLSNALNINYDAETGLFLSPESKIIMKNDEINK
jgi:hypothetical protein